MSEKKFDYAKFKENIDKFFSNMRFMENGEIFTNAKCIVIEFLDICMCPGFAIMNDLRRIGSKGSAYSRYKDYSNASLFEWYVNRKHTNFLYELYNIDSNDPKKLAVDQMYEECMKIPQYYQEKAFNLNFMNILDYLRESKTLVSKIYIYSDFEIPAIRDFLDRYKMTISCEYIYGDFSNLLDTKITEEKTSYVFSDIEKVKILKDKNRLKMSSIILPAEYRYNKIDMNTLKYPIDEWQKEIPFKFGLFNAVSDKILT